MPLTDRVLPALRAWVNDHPEGRLGPALDAGALLVVAALLVWLLPADGGFATLGLRSVAWLLLLAAPVACLLARLG